MAHSPEVCSRTEQLNLSEVRTVHTNVFHQCRSVVFRLTESAAP